jgi:hypothetical protein
VNEMIILWIPLREMNVLNSYYILKNDCMSGCCFVVSPAISELLVLISWVQRMEIINLYCI